LPQQRLGCPGPRRMRAFRPDRTRRSASSLTKKSRVSMRRPSAGTRSPAASSTMSPGTRSRLGTVTSRPSRKTCSLSATSTLRCSAACSARYSWRVSRAALISTIVEMMTKLARSPVSAEIAPAASKINTSGLLNRLRNFRGRDRRRHCSNTLGPQRARRASASVVLRPSRLVLSCSWRSPSEIRQNFCSNPLSDCIGPPAQ
jgi:hypothetical protein